VQFSPHIQKITTEKMKHRGRLAFLPRAVHIKHYHCEAVPIKKDVETQRTDSANGFINIKLCETDGRLDVGNFSYFAHVFLV